MKEKLTARHQQLLNKLPEPDHLELYGAAPRKRGYGNTKVLGKEQEARLFEAVLVLALEFTFTSDPAKRPNVYLFVPPSMEGWATERLKEVTRRMFDVCKEQAKVRREAGIRKAKLLGECFRHLLLGSRVNVATTPPDHWVAFGFENTPETPEWLRNSIIPLYPFLRND